MSKILSEEEFQEFVAEQFANVGKGMADVHADVRELRTEIAVIKEIGSSGSRVGELRVGSGL